MGWDASHAAVVSPATPGSTFAGLGKGGDQAIKEVAGEDPG